MNKFEINTQPCKIGDLACLMICSYKMKLFDEAELFYNYAYQHKDCVFIPQEENVKGLPALFSNRAETIRRLKPHILFKSVAEFHENEITNIEKADFKNLFVTTPRLYRSFSYTILPHLNFDPEHYTLEIPEKNSVCFSFLNRDVFYNKSRMMSKVLCNRIVKSIVENTDKYVYVLCLKEEDVELMDSPKVKIIKTSDLYSIIFLIKCCETFIGGDTGFTWFSCLCRNQKLISIYGQPLEGPQRKNPAWCSNPLIDPNFTKHIHICMNKNNLINKQIKLIVDFINETQV